MSKPAPRKVRKKRVVLNPRPFLVLGVGINLVAGALYSPLTAVRKVRVEGAPDADRARLTLILQELRGVPCAQVHPRRIESEALRNSELCSASLSRTPFGSAVLRIETRTAVARMLVPQLGAAREVKDVGLTTDGVLYLSSTVLDGLPTLTLPDRDARIGLTLGNGWRAVDVARLAILARNVPSPKPIEIVLDRGGRVCLNIGTGNVDLGTFDRLDEKVSRLRETLAKRPDLFETVQTLTLVDVDAPTYTPRPLPPRSRKP